MRARIFAHFMQALFSVGLFFWSLGNEGNFIKHPAVAVFALAMIVFTLVASLEDM